MLNNVLATDKATWLKSLLYTVEPKGKVPQCQSLKHPLLFIHKQPAFLVSLWKWFS